jgi:hypothetical protein
VFTQIERLRSVGPAHCGGPPLALLHRSVEGRSTIMLYAALALVIVAVLSTFAALLGVPLDIGRNASVTALVLAAVALLFFAVGARKPATPRSRR